MGISATSSASPFLRWAGSKRSVLPALREHFPARFARYVEPFVGSACLFFNADPDRALLSDINRDLIETYIAVRDAPADVALALSEMHVSKDDYYFVRSLKPDSLNAVDRAARFIYLNRFCFNGLYRTNVRGEFNVPFGSPKNHSVPSREQLERCAQQLTKAELCSGDFEDIVSSNIGPGDLVYMDPPFYVTSSRVFREYTPKSFCGNDLERLCNLLRRIDDVGANFIVSYSYCPEAEAAFAGWKHRIIFTQRNISGFAQHRRKSQELIVTNR